MKSLYDRVFRIKCIAEKRNDSSKRIAFVMTSLAGGGSQRQMYNLITSLPSEYVPEVYFCTPGVFHSKLKSAGVLTICFEPNKKVKGLNTLKRIIKLMIQIRKRKPHIIHSYLVRANIISIIISKLVRIPVIIDERGFSFEASFFIMYLRRALYRYSTRVVCNSEAIKNELCQKNIVPSKVCHLVRNSVRIPEQIVTPESSIILCVSALRYVKGVDVLLEAFTILIHIHPEIMNTWKLCLAGVGREAGSLRQFALEQNISEAVEFVGWIDKPVELYKKSNIFVLPSRSEGTSNSLLEAMSYSLAPIVTDVGGNPFIIRDRENGIIVQPDSPKELAQAMYMLISQPKKRKQIGMNAFRYVRTLYSEDSNRNGYCKLYNDVLGNVLK